MAKLFNKILGTTGLAAFVLGYILAQEVISRNNPDQQNGPTISSRVNPGYKRTHDFYQGSWSAALMIGGGATVIYASRELSRKNY